jgi:hypothetical protein
MDNERPKYFLISYSRSFKQCCYGTGLLCFIISAAIFFADPDSPNVHLNLAGYTQGQASFFLAAVGAGLIVGYNVLARLFHSDYVPDPSKDNGKDQWLN